MNLGLHVLKNPAGTYSFVGNVPICLSFERKNGEMLSAKEADEILNASMPAMIKKRYDLVTRTWTTKQAAIKEANRFGYKIAD